MPSRTLPTVGKREIGRRSSHLFLYKMIILYISRWLDLRDWYHLFGFPNRRKEALSEDALKMAANG